MLPDKYVKNDEALLHKTVREDNKIFSLLVVPQLPQTLLVYI